jgi:hypothetical protein
MTCGTNKHWVKHTGLFYGYPPCCIAAFQRDLEYGPLAVQMTYAPGDRRDPAAPWIGTGFVPCVACIDDARADFQAFVAKRIAPARACDVAFPEGGR